MTKVMTVVGTRPEIIRLSKVIKPLDATVDRLLPRSAHVVGVLFPVGADEEAITLLRVNTLENVRGVDGRALGREHFVLRRAGEQDATRVDPLCEQVATGMLGVDEVADGDVGDHAAGCLLRHILFEATVAGPHVVYGYAHPLGHDCRDTTVRFPETQEGIRLLLQHLIDFDQLLAQHSPEARRVHLEEVVVLAHPQLFEEDLVHFVVVVPTGVDARLDWLEAVVEEFRLPVLVSTHPRTRKRLEASGRDVAGVTFHRPQGFHDYSHVQLKARRVLSASGSVHYAMPNRSERLVQFVPSTHHRHAAWSGLRPGGTSRWKA